MVDRLPLSFAASVVMLAAICAAAQAAPPGPDLSDVLQVLADLTLVDAACLDHTVDFGVVFRFAARKGVPDVAVMPGGPRRAEFEAVLRARKASFDQDELCGEIAANYAEALPGSVTSRRGAEGRP